MSRESSRPSTAAFASQIAVMRPVRRRALAALLDFIEARHQLHDALAVATRSRRSAAALAWCPELPPAAPWDGEDTPPPARVTRSQYLALASHMLDDARAWAARAEAAARLYGRLQPPAEREEYAAALAWVKAASSPADERAPAPFLTGAEAQR